MTRSLVLAAAAAAVLGLPATATAQGVKPAPCELLPAEEDSATDARVGFAGRYTPVPAEANQEILSFFWRNDPRSATSATRVLRAHLVVKDLNEEVAPGSLGQVYRFFYTTDDGVDRYIEYDYSLVFGEGFYKGYFGDTGPVSEGTAPGRIWRGANGVIQIEVATGSAVTKPITDVRWSAATDRGAVIAQSDAVPNTGGLEWDGKGTCDPPPLPPAE